MFDCIQLSCEKVDDPIILNRQKLNLYYFNICNGKLKSLYTPQHTYLYFRNTMERTIFNRKLFKFM